MNILGISGSVGWDGNISMFLPNLGEAWVHGAGAALVVGPWLWSINRVTKEATGKNIW